jgi:hypothetical protein
MAIGVRGLSYFLKLDIEKKQNREKECMILFSADLPA